MTLVLPGEPPKRAKQLYRWLYGNRKWIRNLDQADSDASAFSGAFKAKVWLWHVDASSASPESETGIHFGSRVACMAPRGLPLIGC